MPVESFVLGLRQSAFSLLCCFQTKGKADPRSQAYQATLSLFKEICMHIAELLKHVEPPFLSLEFFPPRDAESLAEFYGVVERLKSLHPLFASVTYGAGGSRQDATLDVCARLTQMGLNTMAHLTCVGASREKINDFLDKLKAVGVSSVLALRGDPPQNGTWDAQNADFPHASDLIEHIRKREADNMAIGIACYTTPHPESKSYEEDRRYTSLKFSRSGADFGITQLFFDVRDYFLLTAYMKRVGIEKPIIPGILTVQSFAAFKRILSMSGASIPGKLYLQLEEADQKGGNEAVKEAGLNYTVRQIKRLLDGGAKGIHLYTLNRADVCLELVDRLGVRFHS